jgi:hypothetical protein
MPSLDASVLAAKEAADGFVKSVDQDYGAFLAARDRGDPLAQAQAMRQLADRFDGAVRKWRGVSDRPRRTSGTSGAIRAESSGEAAPYEERSEYRQRFSFREGASQSSQQQP